MGQRAAMTPPGADPACGMRSYRNGLFANTQIALASMWCDLAGRRTRGAARVRAAAKKFLGLMWLLC
jgi:hypothetical protein